MAWMPHAAWPQANFVAKQPAGSDEIVVTAAHSGSHTVKIDDAVGFRTPVVSRIFHGRQLILDSNAAALIPGILYHVRLDHGPAQALRLPTTDMADDRINCATLRATWEVKGRFDTGRALSGLQWIAATDREDAHWAIYPHAYLLGESLYNVEMLLRPAITAARACGDQQTLDEIAQYYSIMLQQTETVGQLLRRPRVTAETRARLASVDPDARTFSASWGDEAGEGELYNSQWLHPAAELVRLITLVPEAERTATMTSFAAQYTPFIVKDQLKRYLFDETMPVLGGVSPKGRVARWKLVMQGARSADPSDTAMSDIDLWLLASAAEMLGAHANDSGLVPLDAADVSMLRGAIQTGVLLLKSKRTDYPETKNFRGETVGSSSYFNGDYATHSDAAYSAVGGEAFPSPAQKRALPDVSWDSSHIYRLAVFLRTMYENRKATGTDFPRFEELQAVANQYVYRVFNGNFERPLFHNAFDGSDGWFRVDYNGAGVGYPPSAFCDVRNPKRPCLTVGEVVGWGELAFANPDLDQLEKSLIQMGFRTDAATRDFLARYYGSAGPYQMQRVGQREIYGGSLYSVVAEIAGKSVRLASGSPVSH
jgi:hypothetical protein